MLTKVAQPAERSGETGRDPGQDLEVYERPPSRKLRHAWQVTEALLGAIAERAAAGGARTVVVGAPSFRALDPDRFRALVAAQGLDPARYDPELPGRLLQQAAARQQLPYLDLLPMLRQAAEGEGDVFYPRNTHWAPAGNRAVAVAIDQFLASGGW